MAKDPRGGGGDNENYSFLFGQSFSYNVKMMRSDSPDMIRSPVYTVFFFLPLSSFIESMMGDIDEIFDLKG